MGARKGGERELASESAWHTAMVTACESERKVKRELMCAGWVYVCVRAPVHSRVTFEEYLLGGEQQVA